MLFSVSTLNVLLGIIKANSVQELSSYCFLSITYRYNYLDFCIKEIPGTECFLLSRWVFIY